MEQISGQVKEIKKMVILNQDTLIALYTNRDKPEVFNELFRKLRSKEGWDGGQKGRGMEGNDGKKA